jgi:hypothetical protein
MEYPDRSGSKKFKWSGGYAIISLPAIITQVTNTLFIKKEEAHEISRGGSTQWVLEYSLLGLAG